MTTAFETRTQEAYQSAALEEVKTEHAKYFEALQQHPRLLVGQDVPAIGKEGTERLRDTADAREWQEAVKGLLVEEVRGRAERASDENKGFLDTIHASIELFTKNPDLIPNTKEFDSDLANRFAAMATPYELRVDGKLQGYSIPVQPLVEQLRANLVAERAKAAPPAASAGGAAAGAPAGAGASTPPTPAGGAAAPAAAPQAGIPSKAGNGDEKEDFSTLWGTIGLPDLQI